MAEPVKVGVIGTSWWADLMHLPSLASHGGAQVRGICGRTKSTATRLAKKYRIPEVYTDYREMLALCDLDAMVVATPDDLHHPIAISALRSGLHLLCEKPISRTLQEADEMLRVAEDAGVTHMTMFTFRWVPVFALMQREMKAGRIGRPISARMAVTTGGAFEEGYFWWRDATRCNGALGEFGVHLIDLSRWTLGEVQSVSATVSTVVARTDAEADPANDTASLHLLVGSGVHVSVDVTNAAHIGDEQNRMDVTVFGDQGSLQASLVFEGSGAGARLLFGSDENRPRQVLYSEEFDNSREPSSWTHVFRTKSAGPRAFVDAILQCNRDIPTLADGHAAQRVIDAAHRSHQDGRRVLLA